jgi:uncharacterized membrane protein YhaH (DUF805 family)
MSLDIVLGLDIGSAMIKEDLLFLLRIFSLEGRITREQFWIIIVLTYGLLYLSIRLAGYFNLITSVNAVVYISVVITLLGFFITMATLVKRYHDLGKSGQWALILFLPYLGFFWVLIECGFVEGEAKSNIYGPAEERNVFANKV